MDMDRAGAERLIEGMVRQAVQDWCRAKRRLKKSPKNPDAMGVVTDCENFFLSDWFEYLTEINGRLFLAKLKENMNKEFRRTKYAKGKKDDHENG